MSSCALQNHEGYNLLVKQDCCLKVFNVYMQINNGEKGGKMCMFNVLCKNSLFLKMEKFKKKIASAPLPNQSKNSKFGSKFV